MRLFTTTRGSGPDVVLVHGWALHGGLWEAVATALADDYRVTRVDLPGHGRSRASAVPDTLGAWARAVIDNVARPAHWVGWSLGALVALRATLDFPAAVRSLTTVAGTPRFVNGRGWSNGIAEANLERIGAGLKQDYKNTINDFLGLQVHGSEATREVLRELRAAAFAHGEPSPRALAAGLDILGRADLRAELERIRQRVLIIAGERDRVIPPAAGIALAEAIPHAQYRGIANAAHAPFLSHQEQFIELVRRFLQDVDDT